MHISTFIISSALAFPAVLVAADLATSLNTVSLPPCARPCVVEPVHAVLLVCDFVKERPLDFFCNHRAPLKAHFGECFNQRCSAGESDVAPLVAKVEEVCRMNAAGQIKAERTTAAASSNAPAARGVCGCKGCQPCSNYTAPPVLGQNNATSTYPYVPVATAAGSFLSGNMVFIGSAALTAALWFL